MVCPGHAIANRADEEGRPHAAAPSPPAPQLVSGARPDFRCLRRGLEQQSETDYQKGVRLSVVPLFRNRPVPYARSVTGTGSHPQILLKTHNLIKMVDVEVIFV